MHYLRKGNLIQIYDSYKRFSKIQAEIKRIIRSYLEKYKNEKLFQARNMDGLEDRECGKFCGVRGPSASQGRYEDINTVGCLVGL